ncbi:MAG TPA: GNAT family N-acetyltransferase [Euzebyales bacterium]
MSASDDRYSIGPIGAGDRDAFVRATGLSFGETLDDDEIAHLIAMELDDPARSLAARDGDRIIGTTTVLDYTMSVPGADPVSCAGVTSVGVAPTHRRRGVLRSLMRRQLDDLHAAGTPWAALYASEAGIYGRFGYGVASRCQTFRLDGPWRRFTEPVVPTGVALVDVADAAPLLSDVYERMRTDVPGMMSFAEDKWRLYLEHDPPGVRSGGSARQVVTCGDRGFVVYRIRRGWGDAGPDGTVQVERCMATDSDAWRQLWSYVCGLDLVQHLEAHMRPVDDPLPWWLAERHRLVITDGTSCYIRLVDVGAALSQRGTTADTAVVLDVADTFCPWNTRRWKLAGDGGALQCTPTDEAADAALDVRELGSLSLGGISPYELARAGLIEAHRPDVLDRLAVLLVSRHPPWNPFVF